ncbi:MAG: hypothetical protein ACOX9C_10635 [Kiritimatiellia bacterium]
MKKTALGVCCLVAGTAMAELAPLPEFKMMPHLDARFENKGELSFVMIGAYDCTGRLCPEIVDWVTLVPGGNAPGTIVGVGNVGDRIEDLVPTNAVRLADGRALVVVKRPEQGQDRLTRLVLKPETSDLVGADILLRDVRDVKGVWRRAPRGGASEEVPATWVTNDFEIVTSCDKVYGMFPDPAEPLKLGVECRNVGKSSRKVKFGCRVYDWDGKTVHNAEETIVSEPGAVHHDTVAFDPQEARGIYFAEPYVRDASTNEELVFSRAHLVRLPPHEFKSTAEDSIFGVAASRGIPSEADVQNLMDRLGVKWIRTSGDLRVQHPGRRVNYLNSHPNWRTAMWPEENRDGWIRAQMEYCVVHGAENFEFGNEMNLAVATIGEKMDGIGRCHFADAYISWVKSFDRVMKENGYDKRVNLLGFGMAGFDHAFATKMREAGVLPMLKAFCIHPPTSQFTPDFPYEAGGRHGPPERSKGLHPGDYPTPGSEMNMYWNYLGSIRAAKDFLAKYAPDLPLCVTEMYSSSHPNFIWGPSMRDGADNVVLEYALLKAEGVKVGMYYKIFDGTFRDCFGLNPNDREYTFGLLNRDLSMKPAAMAYCAIAEALDQAEFAGWMKMEDPKTHGLLFTTPRGPMAVLWARWDGLFVSWNDRDGVCRDKEPWIDRWPTKRKIEFPAKGDVVRIDAIGRSRQLESAGGKTKVLLDGSPCMVYGLDANRLETY